MVFSNPNLKEIRNAFVSIYKTHTVTISAYPTYNPGEVPLVHIRCRRRLISRHQVQSFTHDNYGEIVTIVILKSRKKDLDISWISVQRMESEKEKQADRFLVLCT